MREIRFRGKRKDNGEWIYGHLVKFKNAYYILPETATHLNSFNTKLGSFFIEVDPKTVGQYADLEDKNNKEIYEGDIVKTETDYINTGKITEIGVVEFYEEGLVWIINYGETQINLAYAENIEVIGNVYENPELLEEAYK